jgi:hypothetical protein
VLLELLAAAAAQAEAEWHAEVFAAEAAAAAAEKAAAAESVRGGALSRGRRVTSSSSSSSNNSDENNNNGSEEEDEEDEDPGHVSAFDEDEEESGAEWAAINHATSKRRSAPAACQPRAMAVLGLAALVVQRMARAASTQAALAQSLERLVVAAATAAAAAAARLAFKTAAAAAAVAAAPVPAEGSWEDELPRPLARHPSPTAVAASDAAADARRLESVLCAALGLIWAYAPGCYHEARASATSCNVARGARICCAQYFLV